MGLRGSGDDGVTAIRAEAGATAGPVPAASAPQTPVAGAISLQELARQLQAKQAASTTTTVKARTTSTTAKPRATTTTTARARATTTTAPAVVPPRAAPVTTTTRASLTPLTTLVQAVVPPAVAAVTRTDSGIASWFNAPDASCAHRTLPFGTMVKVTRLNNGAVASCKVNDRGPTLETGRLIDLSLDTFEKLAAKEAGLVDVKIEW